MNKDENIAKTLLQAQWTIYFSQLLKTNLFSNYSFLGPTGIYLFEFNNINSKIGAKYVQS